MPKDTQHPLIEKLRKLQIDWQLDLEKLAKISHTSPAILENYFSKTQEELMKLPSIPAELEAAAALVSIHQNLIRTLPDSEKQNEWLITPNEAYEGHKPIEVMAMSPKHVAWIGYTLESSVR